ncbi:MAG TPA: hypothetical protein HA359_04790 [Candidatus Poseidoniaceae archaeon]|nr:MAG TPA: hypothetical protein D7H84_04785 [Candidatus Poseidoniales archaeon]DAC58628.1 MAG TPA: hypothetical protein D7I03_05340 [Candidatus Poseidoniales archaeon]HII23557.1 hypothetical protein [Candidatus Poseidoniaceae archaeon]HII50747.1 hypothetical protein [Candidatus Poseidoniaceae archaeon]|tara:strand:- start:2 stop:685 length:684 start_codon:yes stop_codon:yes gene_type:complete
MDLDQVGGTTSAFYTLHSCDADIALDISNILHQDGETKNESWKALLADNPTLKQRLIDQGMSESSTFEEISWDDSMLLFLCSINIDDEGKPLTIGESLRREKFGRFPFGNGSLISYLIEFLRPNSEVKGANQIFSRIIELLSKLSSFNNLDDYSEARFTGGKGGMNILGFLSLEEVTEIRKLLSGRNWSVASDEPLDGGVRDAIKHFLAMLKAAERIDSGIMHREHL